MNTFTIEVDNLKCGGCANTIRKSLTEMAGVIGVEVDADIKTVTFSGDETIRENVVSKLKSLGYPEKGTTHGIESGVATAKSFVSCAIGRMS